jgi:hypothetical protein
MKKVYLLSLLFVGTLMVIPMVAHAQAVVIKDTSCGVLGPLGPSQEPFTVYDTVKIITPSKNFSKNVSCHGDLPDGMAPPPQAIVWDFDNTSLKCCVAFDGNWFSTTNWHETITPSGNVSLNCHFKGDEPTDDSCNADGLGGPRG